MVHQDARDALEIGSLNMPVSLQPAARPLMAAPAGLLVRQVVRVVVQAKREGLPVSLLEVKAATDPEVEAWRELVVRVSLMCSPETALKAWEELSERLETLRGTLDPFQRELFDETVAFQVVWAEA